MLLITESLLIYELCGSSDVPRPFHTTTEPMFSSSKEQSTIVREKIDSISPPVFNMVRKHGSNFLRYSALLSHTCTYVALEFVGSLVVVATATMVLLELTY